LSLHLPLWEEALQAQGLSAFFTSPSLSALLRYTERMMEINQSLNLTRWTEEKDVLTYHFLDSAQVLPLLKALGSLDSSEPWMDLGTGCGYPGVVLAAVRAPRSVVFVDSVGKKVKAVEDCLGTAGLQALTLSARAEDLGVDPATREKFQGLTCRAVADLRVVLEYGLPLLKVGGHLVNWLTEEQRSSVDKSQKALEVLGGKIHQMADYSLPGTQQKRTLLVVEKMGKTPEAYPRAKGQASKRPL